MYYLTSLPSFSLIVDIDECSIPETNECQFNALCTNNEGSYTCSCRGGYQGDGRRCTGEYITHESLPLVVMSNKGNVRCKLLEMEDMRILS